jgi:hypothetical protein
MTLADEINRMIEKVVESMLITSSGGDSPKTNRVIALGEKDTPDLETMIKDGTTDTTDIKETKRTSEAIKKVELWDKGKVGEVQRFTTTQFSNLRGFVENPAGFMINAVFKKFAKGVGVVALASIILEAVKWIISELLKPGRLLDLRFKRDINKEIIAFRRREDQQKLKQGFSSIIITSSPRLRGSPNQALQTTNTLDLTRRGVFPENIGGNPILIESSGVSLSKGKGLSRGQSRFNR